MIVSFPLKFILEKLGNLLGRKGEYEGNINGFASLSDAIKGEISFFYDYKYLDDLKNSNASIILIPEDLELEPKKGQLLLIVKNPSLEFAKLCREIEFSLFPKPKAGIHASAIIHPTAKVSSEASIGPLCCIGENAEVGNAILHSQITIGRNSVIGDGTIVFPQVVVGSYCIIGKNNRLSEGCVIGSDGYGYIYHEGEHGRVPQIGIVETAERVDIGANTTIDRARIGKTFIGSGTKIDNLVQIAHNVSIGEDCLLIAQTGIAGSSKLKNNVICAGKSGVVGHLLIGENSKIGPMSCVYNSLKPNSNVIGTPAISKILFWRLHSLKQKLPELFKRLK